MLLYSEKCEEFFKEHNVIIPSFCFGQSNEERVMTENTINFYDKVTDKFSNCTIRRIDFYTNKTGNEVRSY
jgi:hypothetical protein